MPLVRVRCGGSQVVVGGDQRLFRLLSVSALNDSVQSARALSDRLQRSLGDDEFLVAPSRLRFEGVVSACSAVSCPESSRRDPG